MLNSIFQNLCVWELLWNECLKLSLHNVETSNKNDQDQEIIIFESSEEYTLLAIKLCHQILLKF